MREETGNSYSVIATALGVSKSTVSRYLAKWRARIPVDGVGVVGRPKKVTENVRKQIRSLISANEHISSKGISAALASGSPRRGSLEVAPRTVRRTLLEMNYKNSTPTRVPILTDRHRHQRIDWCRKHFKFDWKKVVFSDETLIELDRCKLRQWHPKGKRPTKPSTKFSRKTMFWGAICANRIGPLLSVSGTLNSDRYTQLIESHLLPWMTETNCQGHLFQQDNAPCHVSRQSRSFFEAKHIQILDWPSNSPDLNPIENIWGILKNSIEKRGPKSLSELEAMVMEEWIKIPAQTIVNTIQSLHTRIKQVLDRNGEKCDY
jgi:transposase